MSGKTQANKLTKKRKLDIFDELSHPHPPSKRSLGRKYGVSETAIRYIWISREKIKSNAVNLSAELQGTLYRSAPAQYPDLEDKLFSWIEVIRNANFPISPTLIISKAKQNVCELSYLEFKAS